jgi:hypothetical protein
VFEFKFSMFQKINRMENVKLGGLGQIFLLWKGRFAEH